MTPSLPSRHVYRMPAEWEPHEAVWLQWPDPEMRGFPGYARKLLSTWLEMAAILAEHVTVRIAATSPAAAEDILHNCARFGVRAGRVEVHVIPIDDVWARDNGPIFVKDSAGALVVTDWNFNGWGVPTAVTDRDRKVPAAIAALYGLERQVGGIVTEGGALEVNGTGTLMATRSSILNPNRNPGVSQQDAETTLSHLLGISNFIWLSGAPPDECYRLGDATDFHIDLAGRFVGRNVVLANHTDDTSDPHKPYFDQHIAELKAAADETGAPLEVIELPCPQMRSVSTVRFSGTSFTAPPGSLTDASYSNYLVTNGLVLVPVYGRPEDERAKAIIAEHFPGREVVGISAISSTEQGGAIHCVTQQQPMATRAS
ncbi:MAG TPA: agmatine deiminase family protein [Hyphomicrobiaceae bacterium]|nr:agmatine deiminase family protein [Hyphomicrobiaceae bacterium]